VSRIDLSRVTRDVLVHALDNFVSHADHNVLFRRIAILTASDLVVYMDAFASTYQP
jgi:hypothetical protein